MNQKKDHGGNDSLVGIEWTRTTRIERAFGISRAKQYELGEDGTITLSRHRRPGAKHDFVLVNVASVRRYIERGIRNPRAVPGSELTNLKTGR